MPPQVHLVIASRTDPPLPLARLRGRGQLTEIDTNDLRFTPVEVATFLNQVMGFDLSSDEVLALETRTEGWIAGLQMAALSMQSVKDTAGFVKIFTGSHRYILDYLLEEVLNQQPEHVQNFLLQTSILNRLCSPLCDEVVSDLEFQVSGGAANSQLDLQYLKPLEDSQAILEYLEQSNLFIVPLDDERYWYRYHHLFAELLRHRLKQNTPQDQITSLHRRASAWYEQNGFLVEAMSHALAAVDVACVIRLAQQKAATMLSRSELVTLLSWLDTLPRAMERSRPYLSLLHAWAMLLTGELQAVETHLKEAEHELMSLDQASSREDTGMLGEIATLRGGAAYFQRDMPQAIVLYQQALEYLSPDNLFMRGIVLQCLGAAYSWRGDVVEATAAFDEAGTISQSTGNLLVTLIATWNLGQLYREQGQLHQAAQVYRHALNFVDQQSEANRQSLWSLTGRLHIGLAELMFQWNDLEAAEQQATLGIKLGEQEQESSALTGGYLVLAQIEQARGNSVAALECLQQAKYFAQRYAGPRYLTTQVAIVQARLWLERGNLRAVANWVQAQDLTLSSLPESVPYLVEGEYLVAARLLLAQWRHTGAEMLLPIESPLSVALELLTSIYASAKNTNRAERMLETLILQALVQQALDLDKKALTTLEDALILAEPEGYIRLFVDEGQPLAELLRRTKIQSITPNYVSKILAALKPVQPSAPGLQPLLDPLSERELEILQMIATGMSNKELAKALVVTVGTVKWHLNNIYSKLGVRSRTQAVAKARELGLLES